MDRPVRKHGFQTPWHVLQIATMSEWLLQFLLIIGTYAALKESHYHSSTSLFILSLVFSVIVFLIALMVTLSDASYQSPDEID
jgi:hypothetical protein